MAVTNQSVGLFDAMLEIRGTPATIAESGDGQDVAGSRRFDHIEQRLVALAVHGRELLIEPTLQY
jgi:hypothetical protein